MNWAQMSPDLFSVPPMSGSATAVPALRARADSAMVPRANRVPSFMVKLLRGLTADYQVTAAVGCAVRARGAKPPDSKPDCRRNQQQHDEGCLPGSDPKSRGRALAQPSGEPVVVQNEDQSSDDRKGCQCQ